MKDKIEILLFLNPSDKVVVEYIFKIQVRMICNENENKSDFKMTISFVRLHKSSRLNEESYNKTLFIRLLGFCIKMTDKYKINSGHLKDIFRVKSTLVTDVGDERWSDNFWMLLTILRILGFQNLR